MSKKEYVGINIQFPISQLILSGKKTIETRTYPIPPQYIGKELAIVETPGKQGKFKSRIVGTIAFSGSFQYSDKRSFYKDTKRHCVAEDSPWKWTNEKPKWGWTISKVKKLNSVVSVNKRLGIKYTLGLKLP